MHIAYSYPYIVVMIPCDTSIRATDGDPLTIAISTITDVKSTPIGVILQYCSMHLHMGSIQTNALAL